MGFVFCCNLDILGWGQTKAFQQFLFALTGFYAGSEVLSKWLAGLAVLLENLCGMALYCSHEGLRADVCETAFQNGALDDASVAEGGGTPWDICFKDRMGWRIWHMHDDDGWYHLARRICRGGVRGGEVGK